MTRLWSFYKPLSTSFTITYQPISFYLPSASFSTKFVKSQSLNRFTLILLSKFNPELYSPQRLSFMDCSIVRPSSFSKWGLNRANRSTPSPTLYQPTPPSSPQPPLLNNKEKHENIYTLPNLLSFIRLIGSPFLGYLVSTHHYEKAFILFSFIAVTDLLDGFIARHFHMQSIMGTILDPLADKTFMTILTISLGHAGLIPVPLASLIIGRDTALVLASFAIRYKSLPPPKTWSRFWDFSLPTAEVHPTLISKFNTGCQIILMGLALSAPVFTSFQPIWNSMAPVFHYLVATTTIWSGLSYIYSGNAVRYLYKRKP